jgi:hypothetical protein
LHGSRRTHGNPSVVTSLQMRRLTSRAEEPIEALQPERAPVRVVVFRNETPQLAMEKHLKLRPEHCGRRCRLEYRGDERNEASKLFGARSLDEIRAVLEAIESRGRIGDHIARRDA